MVPCKSRKNVSNVKYHDKVKETKLYQWLMLHVATKVEGEKLLSLHHPFDTQINEAMNDVLKTPRCLLDPVACNIDLLWLLGSTHKELHNTQRMCTSNVEWRCNNCKNPSGVIRKSDGTMMQPTSPIQTEKETKRN
jgi:hypothetical protein